MSVSSSIDCEGQPRVPQSWPFDEFPDLLMTCFPHCLHSSQRNVYLTGFTLFLSLVLTRVFAIILDLIETQTAYAALKQQVR